MSKIKHIITALNERVEDVAADWVEGINIAQGVFEELSLREGEREAEYMFTRYGEHPVKIVIDGKKRDVIQVVDREAANQMAETMRQLSSKVATFYKGIPIYEGHADDAAWRGANPGYKPAAVGRIKEITAGNEGIRVRTVFNQRGADMLSGEAPEYSGHSPRWRMREIAGRPGYYRPYILLSDALTNDPNIIDSMIALNQRAGADEPETNKEQTMIDKKVLERLGLKASATDAEISAAMATALNENDKTDDTADKKGDAGNDTGDAVRKEIKRLRDAGMSVEAIAAKIDRDASTIGGIESGEIKNPPESLLGKLKDIPTPEKDGDVAAENIRLRNELEKMRDEKISTAINTAVDSGRITAAQKPTWEKLLKADFESGIAALNTTNVTALNTTNHVNGAGHRKAEGAPETPGDITAMNEAARQYAKDHEIDISDSQGWSKAWEGAKAAKPDLFKPAKK